MIVFGIDVPLPELLFVLIVLFIVLFVLILRQLQRLRSMSRQGQAELAELEKLAQEEKEELEKITKYEQSAAVNLGKFEKEILELEHETDTLYIKKLAPDLYKIQNYTLWALKKGLSPKQIRENLTNKGWKDNRLIQMVIEDTLKYTGYYQDRKGKVEVPSVRIEETTKIIKPVRVVEVSKRVGKAARPKTKSKPKTRKKTSAVKKKRTTVKKTKKASKKVKRAADSLSDVEKKLRKLEKDLKQEGKK